MKKEFELPNIEIINTEKDNILTVSGLFDFGSKYVGLTDDDDYLN